MKRACLLLAVLVPMVVFGLCAPCALALEWGPEDMAVHFVEVLATGDWVWASNLCTDPKDIEGRSPPFVTKYLVFPSISDVKVVDVRESDDTAAVTLSMSAVDFDAVTEDGYTLRDWFVGELNVSDVYAPETMRNDSAIISLLRGANGLTEALRQHTKRYEVPYILRRVEGEWEMEWVVDMKATVAGWGISAVSVAPVSYGTLTHDYAQRRYYAQDAYDDRLFTLPDGLPWDTWLRNIPVEEIFSATGKLIWNVWLRLAAEGDAEGLYGFSVSPAQADCETLPAHFYGFGNVVEHKRWITISNRRRGVLEMHLPIKEGEPISGYTVSARRHMNIWMPMYAEETLSFPLEDVPYESLCPPGGVSFAVQHFMKIREGGTLGELMAHEDDVGYADSIFPDAPEGIGGLPVLNDAYALYRLQGTMEKVPGDFGAYDVTFALARPVDGVYVEAYEQCSMCDAIDGFDMMGAESTCDETLHRAFDVQVLVRIDGRTEEELEELLRALPLTATFSCEEWDFCYEQHGTTTRIGPRTTVDIDTSRMAFWPGTTHDLPIAKYVSVDPEKAPALGGAQ